jgi:hypothetical protein
MHELRWSPSERNVQVRPAPILLKVQIHRLDEAAADVGTVHLLTVVRLECQRSVARDVVQMLAHRAEIVGLGSGYPDDHLWNTVNSALNLLDAFR